MRKIELQMQEYLDYCDKVRLMSKNSVRNKKWVLDNFVKSVGIESIEDITNGHVMHWIGEMTARGCKGRTINNRMAHILAAVRYFMDMGVSMPGMKTRLLIKAKEIPPRRVYYSQEQIDLALRFADQLEWLLISLCYDCGFRISELRNLRLSNIQGQRVVFVGKGSKQREVYMSEKTRNRLQDWVERERVVDYMWVKKRSNMERPLSVDEIRALMKKPFERAGFTDFYPHALRHSFATNICDNGAPLPIAQKMLGHSNLATTERYVHTFDGHLKQYFTQYKFEVA